MSLKIKLFTLRFNSSLGEFDVNDVERFLADKELIEARDHFYLHQGLPYLTLILLYNSIVSVEGTITRTETDKQAERFDPRDVLGDDDWTLYTSLKEWRNELAKSKGIPPYIIATNRQIAEIAKDRPDTMEKLKRIEGLGKAKIASHGSAILEFIGKTKKSSPKEQTKPAGSNDTTRQS